MQGGLTGTSCHRRRGERAWQGVLRQCYWQQRGEEDEGGRAGGGRGHLGLGYRVVGGSLSTGAVR